MLARTGAEGATLAAQRPLATSLMCRIPERRTKWSSRSLVAAAAADGDSPTTGRPSGGTSGSGTSGSGGSGGSGDGSSTSTVRIEYRGRTLQAERGSTLRTALLEAGVTPHNGQATLINCRGLGTCGTCAVEVRGSVAPLEWSTQERLRLNFPPHSPPGNQRLRLACQVACQGDLHVIKRNKFWGQGDDVLPDLPPNASSDGAAGSSAGPAAPLQASSAPLGELEFVLDRRRWRWQRGSK